MNVFRYPEQIPGFRNAVVTVGTFDGVHKGHQKILRQVQDMAAELQGESVVITFDPHPRSVIYPRDHSLKLLSTLGERLALFEKYGVDNVVIVPFTIEFSQLLAREYVEQFLIGKFQPAAIVIGYDHRFGRNREGSINLLREYGKSDGFQVMEIPKQEIEALAISSTKIREAIVAGKIRLANKLLNHPYMLTGRVIHGNKIGRGLGFPTANLDPADETKLLPPNGVYAVRSTSLGEQPVPGMLYIGPRKTLGKDAKPTIEVHFFGFERDIYDETVQLEILEYMRSDMEFSSLEALSEQLRRDREDTLNFFESEAKTTHAAVAMVFLNYNGLNWLQKYLPGWLEVTYPDSEIVIIDNRSTDGSVEWLNTHHPDIQVITLDRNYGFAGGYNEGLRQVEADYFALVNTDVALTPEWLDPVVDLMEKDASIAICQPKILDANNRNMFEYAGASGGMIDTFGYPFCRGRILHEIEVDEGQYDDTAEVFWATGAAFVIRAELFRKFQGFDADYFAHQEEIDLCWRIKQAGYRVMCCPESVIYHEGGGTLSYNQPRKVYLNFRNNLATLVKNSSSGRLLWVMMVRMFLDWLAAINYLTKAQARNALAIFRAQASTFLHLPKLIRKRWKYQYIINHHTLTPRENMRGRYQNSILMDFYLRKLRRFSDFTFEDE